MYELYTVIHCIYVACVLPARQLKNIKNTDSRPSILIHLVKDFELLLGSLEVF